MNKKKKLFKTETKNEIKPKNKKVVYLDRIYTALRKKVEEK